VRIIARGEDKLPTNFSVSRTFRSRLIGQHLSDTSRDLATLTLERSCRLSVIPVFVLHLCTKFEVPRLPVRKILHIYCVSINRPGDFDL